MSEFTKRARINERSFNGINLEEPWDIFFDSFRVQANIYHNDNCKTYKENRNWDEQLCDCTPTKHNVIACSLIAMPKAGNLGDRLFRKDRMYDIREISSFLNKPIDFIEKNADEFLSKVENWPHELVHDYQFGLTLLFSHLKYFEITGKIWDEKEDIAEILKQRKYTGGNILNWNNIKTEHLKHYIELTDEQIKILDEVPAEHRVQFLVDSNDPILESAKKQLLEKSMK